MSAPASSHFDDSPITHAEASRLLLTACERVRDGDTVGARHLTERVTTVLWENHGDAAISAELAAARALWSSTLRDLLSLLEERGEYLHALEYAQDLCIDEPAHKADVQRLSRLHVLAGTRAAHLSTLQNRFRAAQRGEGSLALIHGIAGIGKSSLAHAMSDWAQRQGAVAAFGRCYEQGVALPMVPWQEALRSLAAVTATTTTTTTTYEHLPAPFGHQLPVSSADSLITQAGAYIEELTRERVTLLVLDDLHWAEPGTLELLEYVTRRIERLPLLLLATYRSDEIDRKHPLYQYLPALQRDRSSDSIRLREFEPEDTSRCIECFLGRSQPSLVQYLHRRSDGHPLFLAELLYDLTDQKLLRQDADDLWSPPDEDVSIPALLRQIILQRVAKLGPRCETILSLAAVIGDVWTLSMVETLLDWKEDVLLDEMEKILAARIIEPDDERGERYRFSHGLIREALYRSQIPRRRRQVHGRVSDLLEAALGKAPTQVDGVVDEIISNLVHHAFSAEQWARAFRFGREAADRAGRRHVLHAVIYYGRQALDAAVQDPNVATVHELFELHEQLGHAALMLGRKDEALDSFTQMLKVADDTDDRERVANAMFRLAEAQERTYEHERSAETRRIALELVADETAPRLLARFHFSMAHHGMAVGKLHDARTHLYEAERYAHSANDEQIVFDCERHRAYLAIFQSEYGTGEELAEASLTRARAMDDAPRITLACWQLGFVLIERGKYTRARQVLLEGLDQSGSIGEHHFYLIRIRNLLGYLYREIGDPATAMRWNQEALDTNRQDGTHRATECACYSLVDIAANHLAAGQIEAAEASLHRYELFSEGTTYARYRYGNRAQLLRAELALAREEYDSAETFALQAMEVAKDAAMRKNMVRALLFHGQALTGLGRLADASMNLQQSVNDADDIGHAALRWQTRLALADALERLGHSSKAFRQEAHDIVNHIAEELVDSDLRDTFLNSTLVAAAIGAGDTAPAVDEPPETPAGDTRPAGLTNREAEVLSLVAAGMTDRQISEQLHIAVRTVNTHVTNILNKTGCENRTAAAAFAVRHGLADPT